MKKILRLIIILCIFLLGICGIILTKQKKDITYVKGTEIAEKNMAANEITSLDTPTGLVWKEGSTATASWNAVENANYYLVNIYVYDVNDNLIGDEETGTSDTEIDIQQEINHILDGKSINSFKVTFKTTATYIYNNETIMSDISDESIEKQFEVGAGIFKINTPMDIIIDDDYNASWSAPEGTDHYGLVFNINGKEKLLYGVCVFNHKSTTYSYGTTSDGVFTANIEKAISEFYSDMVRTNEIQSGETVKLKFRVKARPSSTTNSNYIESDYSEYSNSFNYSDSTIKKIKTPTDIIIDDDYNASWSAPEGTDHYGLVFNINGKEKLLYGVCVFNHKSTTYSYGTTSDGVFTANIEKAISEFYSDMVRTNEIQSGETVKLKFRVKARPSSTTNSNYIESEYSIYSNEFYYNCDGPTKISSISLSPNVPVIAVGRSLYIGKTVTPNNALYSNINWSSSNYNIVTINNMGKITGLRPGNATITAKINNASQTADVSVYEIQSNAENYDDSNNLIDEANDVIEAVITDGDFSNTDINDKEIVVDEIVQGAENGNMFNANIKYEQTAEDKINVIKNEVEDNYNGYLIAGANNINIEISHEDEKGINHHIANITELKNEVNLKFDLSNKIPHLDDTKSRDFKLLRKHNDSIEDIDFEINDGIIETKSDKFSDFILLYKDTDIPVDGIQVDKENIEINLGEDENINVSVLPENAANRNFNAISNNTGVAMVEGNKITAVGIGNTNITFTSEEGNFSKDVNVTVVNRLKNIKLNRENGSLNVGDSENLTVTYEPVDTTDDKTIEWVSSNTNVATVDLNGNIIALDPGQTTITAKVGTKVAEYKLIVYSPLNNIMFEEDSNVIQNGKNKALKVIYNPTNTTDDKTLEWASSDEKIATVDSNGIVTVLKCTGTAIITAKSKVDDNITATTTIAATHSDSEIILPIVVKENVIDATCTKEGSYDEVVYCSTCNEELSRKSKIIEKLNHSWNNGTITKHANCKEEGIKTYTCTGCSGTKTETIPATGHSFDNGKITKTATYDEEGIKTYTCSKCGTTKQEKVAKLEKTSIANITITGIKNKTYNGKKQTQSITVKLGNKTLKNGTDYSITYKNNKKVGTATVVITGKGAYTGMVNKTFKINPKGTSLKKLTTGKKQLKATWNKQATQTTGYEIQYSTNKNFKSGKKKIKVKKNKTTSSTIKKLKAKKKYYVRIRTYKTVNGKTYYSGWSKVKNVTTKK